MKEEFVLNHQSTGLLTNLEFSEKANRKILSWVSICLLKYLTKLQINYTRFHFVFLHPNLGVDWHWGGKREENRRAVSEVIAVTRIWIFRLLGD